MTKKRLRRGGGRGGRGGWPKTGGGEDKILQETLKRRQPSCIFANFRAKEKACGNTKNSVSLESGTVSVLDDIVKGDRFGSLKVPFLVPEGSPVLAVQRSADLDSTLAGYSQDSHSGVPGGAPKGSITHVGRVRKI